MSCCAHHKNAQILNIQFDAFVICKLLIDKVLDKDAVKIFLYLYYYIPPINIDDIFWHENSKNGSRAK